MAYPFIVFVRCVIVMGVSRVGRVPMLREIIVVDFWKYALFAVTLHVDKNNNTHIIDEQRKIGKVCRS